MTEIIHLHSFHPWRDTDGGFWLQYRRCVCGETETRERYPEWVNGAWEYKGPHPDSHTDRSVMYYTGGSEMAGDLFSSFTVRLLWSTFLFCHGAAVDPSKVQSH